MAVHVYTGDGKGKTTCATGLAARFAGHGNAVAFVRFLKWDESGECKLLSSQISFYSTADCFGFVFQMSAEQKKVLRKNTRKLWDEMLSFAPRFDMIVLDEIFGAIACGFVAVSDLLRFLGQYPEKEIVLTGRDAPPEIVALADYVTEMKCIKHIYEKGINARPGVEF